MFTILYKTLIIPVWLKVQICKRNQNRNKIEMVEDKYAVNKNRKGSGAGSVEERKSYVSGGFGSNEMDSFISNRNLLQVPKKGEMRARSGSFIRNNEVSKMFTPS
jgi:hypothetical protein